MGLRNCVTLIIVLNRAYKIIPKLARHPFTYEKKYIKNFKKILNKYLASLGTTL